MRHTYSSFSVAMFAALLAPSVWAQSAGDAAESSSTWADDPGLDGRLPAATAPSRDGDAGAGGSGEEARSSSAPASPLADSDDAAEDDGAGTRCVLGKVSGVQGASAETVKTLVCDALRDKGVPIGSEAGQAVYRVSLSALGKSTLLRVAYESPAGTVRDSRKIILGSLEEATFVAPRVAGSLVDGTPLKETEQVDNLTAGETRRMPRRPGETSFGLGILGISAPQSEHVLGPGFELMLQYETPDFAILTTGRIGGVEQSERDMLYMALTLGGRYFLSRQNTSALVGGGVSLSRMDVEFADDESDDYYWGSHEGGGLGTYVEVGVEFLRLQSSHLILALRADLPFYSLERESYSYPRAQGAYDPDTGEYAYVEPVTEEASARYVVPVTLSLSYAF